MTLLINAVLVAIKRFVLSIHLILFFVYQVCLHKLQLRLRRLELWGEFRTSHDIGHFLGQSVRIVGPASITGLLMRLRDAYCNLSSRLQILLYIYMYVYFVLHL